MLEQIYNWIQNIAVYLIVMSAVMHVIPGKDYGKYIRFFSGLVLILLLFSPVLKITGMEADFLEIYRSKEYEAQKREIEKAEEIYEKAGLSDGSWMELPEDSVREGSGGHKEHIKVEEIEIGD